MKQKRELFEGFHKRMEAAIETHHYLEASWYAYALIEDRLSSLLRNSGGVGRNGSSTPIKMLGPKLTELNSRASSDELLKANLLYDDADQWRDDRNQLMHAMADGLLSQSDIDKNAYLLATKGVKLVKELSSAAMRLKKHRAKVS